MKFLDRRILYSYSRIKWGYNKKYIQDQEKHDIAMDKLSVKEYEDPFKG